MAKSQHRPRGPRIGPKPSRLSDAQRPQRGDEIQGAESNSELSSDWRWLVLVVIAGFLVFANSLSGEFVYDDLRQILRNPLIQENALVGKALTSDVWAFKGDGVSAASNYWRPSFTLLNIVCFRLFGATPWGWHLVNVLMFCGVCALAFTLLRQLGMRLGVAFAVALLFAVHPIHTESVAWIAGSPDLIFALGLLGSLLCLARGKLGFALTFYTVALGAKEVAVLCFPLHFLMLAQLRSTRDSLRQSLVFGALAVGYFFLRWALLGQISIPRSDGPTLTPALQSLPSVLTFYMRQMLGPFELAANYAVRPLETLSLAGFVLPLGLVLAALVVVAWLAWNAHDKGWSRVALGLLVLPLVPALNVMAFPSDQMVHDRYAFLPLLGFLMLLVPALERGLARFHAKAGLIALIVACVALAWHTVRYNAVWRTDLSLWEAAVKVDPHSASNWTQYGSFLLADKRNDEGERAFSRAIAIRDTAMARVGRARALVSLKKFAEAETDAAKAIGLNAGNDEPYTLYQAYEILAISQLERKELTTASRTLLDARRQLPLYAAALTEKLAIAYYQGGRKAEALGELESMRTRARQEHLPESKNVFLRLGQLYAESGRNAEAKTALQEFMDASEHARDLNAERNRKAAADLLQKL